MPTPPGPRGVDLVRRLRAWSLSSWRTGDRIDVVRRALDGLALLAQSCDSTPRPAVPDAGVHALADQLAVLIADALDAGAEPAQLDALLLDLERNLGLAGRWAARGSVGRR